MSLEPLYKLVEKLIDSEAKEVFKVLMEENREMTEEELAEKTGLKTSSVRRALNMLAEKGFVIYRKVRSPERGRMVFCWRVNAENLHAILVSRKKSVLEQLKIKLEHEETTYYYVCPLDGSRYTMEEAMDYNFSCPRCGSMLVPEEGRELKVEVLKSYVKKLEEELREESKLS